MIDFTRLALVCTLVCIGSFLNAQTFETFPAQTIPDDGCIADSLISELTVTGVGVLSSNNKILDTLCLDISHTWVADVEVYLESPSNTIVEITTGNGGSEDNYSATCFNDNASPNITSGTAPFTGTFQPESSLSSFFGENADGVWKLRVCDNAEFIDGTLNSWSLTFGEPPLCTPISNITPSSITATSASYTWADGFGCTSPVEIEYGTAGFVPGTGTVQMVDCGIETVTINGLISDTPYELYFTNTCSDTSLTTGPVSFTTDCTVGCDYQIVIEDSYGDGWNGGQISLRKDTIDIAVYTGPLNGIGPDTLDVLLCEGSEYALIWNSCGSFPTEMSIKVLNPFGIEIYSMPANTVGCTGANELFSFTGDCQQPDCFAPTVSDTVRTDCTSPWTMDVVIGTDGTGASYTISDDQGTAPVTNVAPGSTTGFGSYAIGTIVTITIQDEVDTCNVTRVVRVQDECLPECATLVSPTDGAIDQLTNTLFEWEEATSGGAPTGYRFVLGTSNPPMDTLAGTFTGTDLTVFNLQFDTTYWWAIIPVNGAGEAIGCEGDARSFTVKSAPDGPMGITCVTNGFSEGIVYEESLEDGDFPVGWTGDLGDGTTAQAWNVGTGATASPGTGPTSASDGAFYMFFEASTPPGIEAITDSAYVTTDTIDLTSTIDAAELSFDMHAFGAGVGRLTVGVSTSQVGPWTTVFDWSGALSFAEADTFTLVGASLAGFLGQKVFLHFTAEYGGSFTGDIAVDNIKINSCTNCSAPQNLASGPIGADTATISWIDGAGCTNVELRYDTTGFTLGTGNTLAAICGDETATISGLVAETSYDVYLIHQCVSGVIDTIGPISFTTECAIIIPSYLNTIDNVPPDNCWIEATDGTPSTGPVIGNGDWVNGDFANVAGASNAARINLFNTGTSDWLITPLFDLSTGGPFSLQYDFALTGFSAASAGVDTTLGSDDTVQILISEDMGLTWTALQTYDANVNIPSAGANENINLGAFNGIVQFAFYGSEGVVDDASDVNFYIDNFAITDPSGVPGCTAVSNPANGAIDVNENVTLSWPPASGDVDGYRVFVGSEPGGGDIVMIQLSDTTDYEIPTQLDFDSTYYVVIIPTNSNGPAENCDTTSFTIRSLPCGVIDASADNVTSSTVTLNWTDEAGCANLMIEYGPSPITFGGGTSVPVNCGDGTVDISGLTGDTGYDVFFYTDCGMNTDTVAIFFTTDCGIFTVPYLNELDVVPDSCWSEATSGTAATGPGNEGFGDWLTDGFPGDVNTSSSARINLFFNNDQEWLITPEFDLSGDDYFAFFDIALTIFAGSDATTLGSDDSVQFLVTIDSGMTWQALRTWTAATPISATGEAIQVDLAAFTSAARFAFYATDGLINDPEDNEFFMDNFAIDVPPTCGPATNLMVANIGTDTADVSWVDGPFCANVSVEFGPSPYTPGTGTIIPLTCGTEMITLMGLASATEYELLVINDCPDGSDTTQALFTTDCEVFEIPYCETFDVTVGNVTADCWTIENVNNDSGDGGSTWDIEVTTLANSATRAAVYGWNGDNNADDWLYSPGLNLRAGTEYNISFAFKARSTGFPESMEVYAGQGTTAAAMTDSLFSMINFNQTEYHVVSLSYTPEVDAVFNIGFHAISDADQFELLMDDFCITDCSTGLVTNNHVDGPGSLMDIFLTRCAADPIMFDNATAGDTFPFEGVMITDDLTLMGLSLENTVISVGENQRHFWVRPGAMLTLKDVSLIGASLPLPRGGAINNAGMLNLERVNLEGNTEGATPKGMTLQPGSTTTIDGGETSVKN